MLQERSTPVAAEAPKEEAEASSLAQLVDRAVTAALRRRRPRRRVKATTLPVLYLRAEGGGYILESRAGVPQARLALRYKKKGAKHAALDQA